MKLCNLSRQLLNVSEGYNEEHNNFLLFVSISNMTIIKGVRHILFGTECNYNANTHSGRGMARRQHTNLLLTMKYVHSYYPEKSGCLLGPADTGHGRTAAVLTLEAHCQHKNHGSHRKGNQRHFVLEPFQ